MPRVVTCPQGHQWQTASAEPVLPTPAPCPVCGAAAQEAPARPAAAAEADTLPPAGPPAPAPPARLPAPAGYEVLGELGRGGMGVVYQARHLALDRRVALKMILAGSHAGAADLSCFRTEAAALARLQHSHIVQIFEVGEHGGLPYFALEFCPGGSLAARLAGTPLPPREAAALVETLARAVHAAHQAGIMHRDLKPANVLLGADGQPKLTDFGLAKKLDAAAGQTATGAILGTPSYMAPEQAGGKGQAVGPAADVYALGALLYEVLTGRPPFLGPTPWDTVLQVVSEEAVSPRQLQPKLPRDLDTICLKCLHKEPGQRYASAQALADDLGRFLKSEPIQARPVSVWERGWRWAKRRPAVAALLAVLALVVTGSLLGLTGLWLRAVKAKEGEETAKDLAQKRYGETRLRWYIADMNLAQRAWDDGHVGRVLELLEGWRPRQAEDSDLRGFEWFYLWHLCHSELLSLRGHTGMVHSVAFSPDGKRLASASDDGTVKLWDAPTGQETLALKGHTGYVRSVAFSPEGKRLASAGDDKTVKDWDAPTGQESLTLKGHTREVMSGIFSPDGKRLASASADKTVKVWDAPTGPETLARQGHSDR